MSATLPVIFLSHGSPLHALEPGAAGRAWAGLARRLPRPRALLVASAHWETDHPVVTGSPRPETIHDFYGFPRPLYRIRYPAPGAPDVAARARELLEHGGLRAAVDGERGLDHGAWSPLLFMYPDADVPVVQVSLQTPLGGRHHLALGRALAPLAGEDVLVVGSGQMTHNLRERVDAPALPYVREFQAWMRERLFAGDADSVAEYRARAPHAARAHPSEEHFMPLLVALGAAGAGPRAECLYDAVESGVLAMDLWLFNPQGAASPHPRQAA